MPLINTSIPNLIQGVSQQPDAVRFDGQCEEQVNALGSITEGLQKRPPTEFVNNLFSTEIPEDAFVGFIDRDDDEAYVVVVQTGKLNVFHAQTGTPATIDGLSNTTFTSTNYLYSNTPKESIQMLAIGDTTYLLNKDVATDMDTSYLTRSEKLGSGKSLTGHRRAIIFIKQGAYKTEYKVELLNSNDAVSVTAEYTSGPSRDGSGNPVDINATTSHIRDGLFNTFTSTQQSTYDIELLGTNGIILTVPDSGSIRASDGLGDSGLGLVFEEAANITDLPIYCVEGFKVKVAGDGESNADDYYVKFRTTVGENDDSDYANERQGKGTWVETVGPEEYTTIDQAKMPRVLTLTDFSPNTNIATFSLANMLLDTKRAGDSVSNPSPSFIGEKLDNIFLFKNRLGFLFGQNLIMTESGLGKLSSNGTQQYNFFRNTVTTLLDGDPIDLAVSTEKVTFLKHAIQFQSDLILFSDNGQFVLKGGDLLTPRTVSVTRATTYESDNGVPPVGVGQYMYFPFKRGTKHTGVKEFMVNADSDVYLAEEITSHVPSYIPNDVIDFTASETDNIMALTTGKIAPVATASPDVPTASELSSQGYSYVGLETASSDGSNWLTTDLFVHYNANTPSLGNPFHTYVNGQPALNNLVDTSNNGTDAAMPYSTTSNTASPLININGQNLTGNPPLAPKLGTFVPTQAATGYTPSGLGTFDLGKTSGSDPNNSVLVGYSQRDTTNFVQKFVFESAIENHVDNEYAIEIGVVKPQPVSLPFGNDPILWGINLSSPSSNLNTTTVTGYDMMINPNVTGHLGLKLQNMNNTNATTAFMMNGTTTAYSTELTPHRVELGASTSNVPSISYHLLLNMSPSKTELKCVDSNGNVSTVWTLNDPNVTYSTLKTFASSSGLLMQNFGVGIHTSLFVPPASNQNEHFWGNLGQRGGAHMHMFRIYNRNLTSAELSYNGLNNNFRMIQA